MCWYQSRQSASKNFSNIIWKYAYTQLMSHYRQVWRIVCEHSHKKRIVWKHNPNWPFYAFVENQAIIESILLYRGWKCKQTKEQGSEDMDPYYYIFIRLLSVFFSFFCQDANKTKSNCAIMGCNLSKKHKLTLYKTQNGEPNYVARS